jgi:hypothetical protein
MIFKIEEQEQPSPTGPITIYVPVWKDSNKRFNTNRWNYFLKPATWNTGNIVMFKTKAEADNFIKSLK